MVRGGCDKVKALCVLVDMIVETWVKRGGDSKHILIMETYIMSPPHDSVGTIFSLFLFFSF